jgi:hypothetical protein
MGYELKQEMDYEPRQEMGHEPKHNPLRGTMKGTLWHKSSPNTAQIVKVPVWHNPWDTVRPSVQRFLQQSNIHKALAGELALLTEPWCVCAYVSVSLCVLMSKKIWSICYRKDTFYWSILRHTEIISRDGRYVLWYHIMCYMHSVLLYYTRNLNNVWFPY